MDLVRAIGNTRGYAKFFDFALFPTEIHHWLIVHKKVSLEKISLNIDTKKSTNIALARRKKTFSSLNKIIIGKRFVRIIRWIPGIRLVALTGSVAAGNALPEDDIDLLIITSSSSLWIVRPITLITISLFFRRRLPCEDPSLTKDAFCPNLWLDSSAMRLPRAKRSLYSAHEILQTIPILDKHNTYSKFLRQNAWVKHYLANAYYAKSNSATKVQKNNIYGVFIAIVYPINILCYVAQKIYMLPKKTTEKVGLHMAYLHTHDYSKHIKTYLGENKSII